MPGSAQHLRPVERLVFFTDAVVAIGMTLLILPLLDSVGEAARQGLGAAGYFRSGRDQLTAFVLSFVIIAVFWRDHDRLFEHVKRQDGVLARLNVAWMLTVVWLPVATALVGSMPADRLQLAVYIGSMLATSLLALAMRWWLARHPELLAPDARPDPAELASAGVTAVLYLVALLLALSVPALNYWALLVLALSPILKRIARRQRPS